MWQIFLSAGVVLSVEWIIVYGGANWITSLHHYRVPLRTRFDTAIPFIPAAVVFYLSLFPMLWIAPFILHTSRELRAFAWALSSAILIAGIGFVVFPAQPIDLRSIETDRFGRMFHFADWINLDYNYFPSLHVAMAVICAASFSRSKSTTIGIVFWLWAVLIALSTLPTHQHYVSDVMAGGLLGAVVMPRQPPHVLKPWR